MIEAPFHAGQRDGSRERERRGLLRVQRPREAERGEECGERVDAGEVLGVLCGDVLQHVSTERTTQ